MSMTPEEFLRELEEALEIQPGALRPTSSLVDVEAWDSMSALIFMSAADEKLAIQVTGDQIAECATVGDLLALLSEGLAA